MLDRYSLALSTTLSSTAAIWCVVYVDYSPCHSHRSRTSQRHQVPRPTRSRHSVLLSLIFRWASLVMSVHRLCHCALCPQHTTQPQQTPLRNSPSRSFCSCVLPNTPSGVQFHSAFMKTFVKHRPPATLETRWKSRSPMPPRSSLSLSSSTGASFPEPSRRVPSPAPLCFKMQLLGPPHTVPLSQMRPPNSRSQSSFLGASTRMTRWIDSFLSFRMGTLRRPTSPSPKHMDVTLSFSSSSGGDVRTPIPRTQLNGAPPLPPGLEVHSPLSSPHGILVKAAPVRPRSQLVLAFTSSGASFTSSATPSLQPQVSTTRVGTHSAHSTPAHKRSAGVAPEGNPLCHWCRPTCWTWPFPEASACGPAHGQFWTDQTCWTRPHSQCGQ